MFWGWGFGGSLFSGQLIMAYKNLSIGVDVAFHPRALKFKWPPAAGRAQLQ